MAEQIKAGKGVRWPTLLGALMLSGIYLLLLSVEHAVGDDPGDGGLFNRPGL